MLGTTSSLKAKDPAEQLQQVTEANGGNRMAADTEGDTKRWQASQHGSPRCLGSRAACSRELPSP